MASVFHSDSVNRPCQPEEARAALAVAPNHSTAVESFFDEVQEENARRKRWRRLRRLILGATIGSIGILLLLVILHVVKNDVDEAP